MLLTLTLVRYLWAAPNTFIGLLLAIPGIAAGGRIRFHSGVFEAEGRLLAWFLTHASVLEQGVAAITFGHVILACDRQTLANTRAHERVHVRQYERWGPLFIPLYLAASIAAFARGEHPYYGNVFEREARIAESAGGS